VDEAVVGFGIHDDLAVVAVTPCGAEGLDVVERGPRVLAAEDRQRGAHLRGGGQRVALPGTAPIVGHADHPVEGHRARERPGGRGLERVHAAHAEPEDRDAVDAVVGREESGRGGEIAELHVVVHLLHVRHAHRRIRGLAHLGREAGERLGAHDGEPVRGEPAAEILEQVADAEHVGMHNETGVRLCRRSGMDGVHGRTVAGDEDEPFGTRVVRSG